MHNKILSLFNYNLETDFSKAVLEQESEVNSQGFFIRLFTRKFQDKFYNIFETITVKDFGQCCNIILSSKKFSIWKLYRFKKLINGLYKIYGPDQLKGKYSTKDFKDLIDKEMDFYFIRNWQGIEKELLPCDIIIDKTTNLMELIIFGATVAPEIKESW